MDKIEWLKGSLQDNEKRDDLWNEWIRLIEEWLSAAPWFAVDNQDKRTLILPMF